MASELLNSSDAAVFRPANLRQGNSRVILRLIRSNSPCSRADLTRLSGLSAPTVASTVSGLEEMGLVESIGEGQSSGGRPPEMLRFRPEYAYVAGADIGGTRLRMMLSDMEGEPVGYWKTKLEPSQKDPESICKLLRTGLMEMCSEAQIDAKKVVHLTVGAPGITDVDRGVVLSAPNLTDWNDVPLRDLLMDKLGFDVTAENDTNLAAVGERWRGAAAGQDDYIFIAMGTGVGAGIFLRGQIHHGSAWSAGEIGYLGVPGMAREPMEMRRTGQLEREIGGAGIEARWLSALDAAGVKDDKLRKLRASQIFDVADEGNPVASEVLQYAARVLADAVSTITLLFNPSLVVMGGGVGAHQGLCAALGAVLSESDFPHPKVRCSVLGQEAQLYGAIALSLQAADKKLFSQV